MFDIGATELLLIVVVAVVVIGPKDLPLALRTAGRWIGKMRRLSNHFRAGLDAMVREAEMEEMEKKWREQNERIMREHPADAPPEMERTGALPSAPAASEMPAPATAASSPPAPASSLPDPLPTSGSAEAAVPAGAASPQPVQPYDTTHSAQAAGETRA
jgi:sec-independent protein translocase protein TatB